MVISDTDVVYLYGLDIIAEQLAGADRYYYMHDGLGSVRQLLDTTGQIATRYAYDPFGVPLEGNGVPNPWQFTGEAWDAEVELLYLRARYYQPGTGRFVTKDPRPGSVWRPGTLNRYVYVANNPVNWVDSSGLQEAWRVTPDWHEEETGTPTPGPAAIPTPGPPAIPTARPQPSPIPTPSGLAELHQQEQYEYSPLESVSLAMALGIYNWFFEIGDPLQTFGPEYSLTQDVRYSPSLALFREAWKEEAQARGGKYPVPWHWYKDAPWRWWYNDAIGQGRGDAPLHQRLLLGTVAYEVENIQLAMCVLFLGSPDPEGDIDPAGATFGSFNRISAYDAGGGMVRIEAYNVMGWASFTRVPGVEYHPIRNRTRGEFGPGGTVHQWFYWYEERPGPIQSKPQYTM